MKQSNKEETKESVKTAQNYFKANAKHISQTISLEQKDYLMHVEDCHGIGIDSSISLAAYISYISATLGRPLSSQMMVLDFMTVGGTLSKEENLDEALQVCFDAGAKKILLPMSNVDDIATVPNELFAKFQTSFYTSPEDAAIKALGIE